MVKLTEEIVAVLKENDNCPMTVQVIASRITAQSGEKVYASDVARRMTAIDVAPRFKVTAKLRE